MNAKPGTYALVLQCPASATTQVGRWGRLSLEPGYYIYVGSAFGPGGVQARVLRHCRRSKSRHWHIDYLREYLSPVGAWYNHEPTHLEHEWAGLLSGMGGLSSIPGFGCSDCRCGSHLFRTSSEPEFTVFSSAAGGKVERWSYPRPG